MAIDLQRRHLFLAELENGSVGVVDVETRAVVHRIAGLKEPQGIGYAEGADLIYVAGGGDGTVRRYRAADFTPAGTLRLGEDADNVRALGARGLVVVGFGEGALALLDAASGRKTADIPMPAHPESFRLTADGARAFVNLPGARQIAVVDLARGVIGARWRHAAHDNFPMALDETQGRLFVVYRKPPTLVVFDTGQGAAVAAIPTCGDADDISLDRARQRLYVSCGAGEIAVADASGRRALARVRTMPGARTSLFVPALDRLFVAVPAWQAQKRAELWVFRPVP